MTQKVRLHRLIQILGIFLVYLFLQVLFRQDVLLHGRFFAEEGSIWWANSLSADFFDTFTFVPPSGGYFQLYTNLLMILVKFIPISLAPLVTTWVSFLVQTQVAILFLILTRQYQWRFRLLGFTIFLASPILAEPETFANSINSQVFLGLTSILYLILWITPKTKPDKIYTYLILFISFFSGWYAVILTPIIMARYLLGKKTKFHLAVVITAFLALILQTSIALHQRQAGSLWPRGNKSISIDEIVRDLASIFYFTGFGSGKSFTDIAFKIVTLALILVLLKYAIHTTEIDKAWIRSKTIWAVLAFLAEYFLVYFGDAWPTKGLDGRYLIVPSGTLSILFMILGAKVLEPVLKGRILFFFFLALIAISFSHLYENRNSVFLNCDDPCITWQENLEGIEKGELSAFYFWVINHGNPDWAVSSINPKIRLAPFQAETIGIEDSPLPPLGLDSKKS